MNPSRKPSWRVVIQRLASAIVALPSAAADRHDLVEQVRLELADERRERADVGPDPARPVDDAGALDDARQLRPEGRARGPARCGHRLGVGGLAGPQLGRGERTRRARPAGRSRSVRRPASRRGRSRACRSIRRPTTVAAAPSADPMRSPACHAPVVAPVPPGRRLGGRVIGRPVARASIDLDVREVGAEHPRGDRRGSDRRRRSSAGDATAGAATSVGSLVAGAGRRRRPCPGSCRAPRGR